MHFMRVDCPRIAGQVVVFGGIGLMVYNSVLARSWSITLFLRAKEEANRRDRLPPSLPIDHQGEFRPRTPIYDVTNGIITAAAKCNVDGICH